MKLGFAGGKQDNLKGALLALGYCGAVDLRLETIAAGVLDLERAGAAQLDAVMEDCAGGQGIGAKAGAGVVDLEQLNWRSGAVLNGCIDVIGVAAGCGWECADCDGGDAGAQQGSNCAAIRHSWIPFSSGVLFAA